MAEFKNVVDAQVDFELASRFGAIAITQAQQRQRAVQGLADRIATLANRCKVKVRRSNCRTLRSAAEAAAINARQAAVGQAEQESAVVRATHESIRQQWQAKMDEAARLHRELRQARDQKSEFDQLNKNRQQITETGKFGSQSICSCKIPDSTCAIKPVWQW